MDDQLMRFDAFMRHALYDRESGYYNKGPERVGKAGDFFTSVSVGDLFGRLLCRRFHELWMSMGRPDSFLVVEAGANDGRLAADIITEAGALSSGFSQAIRYIIIEPLESLHAVQRKTTDGRAAIVSSARNCPRGKGVYFANELLDAFPVRIAEIRQGSWRERYVRMGASPSWELLSLREGEGPPVPPSGYPEGYITEWFDGYDAFISDIEPLLEEGLYLFIDYGRDRGDYYSAKRSEGTLRTYHRHSRTDDPLIHIGEQDITADVDFTAVALEAKSHGLVPALYLEQAHWLTSVARPWLLNLETNPLPPEKFRKEIGQFQTLTHPRHMGFKFKVLELFKGPVRLPDLLFQRTGIDVLGI